MNNPYVPQLAVIQGITEESQNTRTFTISLKPKTPFDPEPGQFIEFSMVGHGEFPVSIAGVDDTVAGVFQTTVRRVGEVTQSTADLKVSSVVGVRGPFGKGYTIEKMKGKDVILVAGGLGMASIKYLVECLLKNRDNYKRIILIYGAATPGEILYKYIPSLYPSGTKEGQLEVLLTVDHPDAYWKGNVGNVIGLIDKILPGIDVDKSIVAACGPSKMMKAVVDRLIRFGFDEDQLLLSFERRMQCGIGVCGHCRIGDKRVCLDGPVIPFHEIKDTLEDIF